MAKKRQPGSRRRPDAHTSEQEDAFVASVVGFSSWAKKNSQLLILAGVALLVVVFGVMYYVNYRGQLQVRAVQELEAIQQTMAMGDPAQAQVQLNQYLERFSGTPYAGEARLLLAETYLASGEAVQAAQVLEDADIGVAEPLGPQVSVLLARAYEAQDRLDEAEDPYMTVAARAELRFQRVQALQDAARLRMTMGNPAGAADLYEQILDDMEPNDPDRGLIEMRLAEAQTLARTT